SFKPGGGNANAACQFLHEEVSSLKAAMPRQQCQPVHEEVSSLKVCTPASPPPASRRRLRRVEDLSEVAVPQGLKSSQRLAVLSEVAVPQRLKSPQRFADLSEVAVPQRLKSPQRFAAPQKKWISPPKQWGGIIELDD
ncbi:unnamed protein product, partial [Polarella glacialis]